MQILLTEDEHRALTKAAVTAEAKLAATLQDLCTKVADHMPVNAGWRPKEPSPWGCILTSRGEWYCDACPVKGVCPNTNKLFSQ